MQQIMGIAKKYSEDERPQKLKQLEALLVEVTFYQANGAQNM